MGFSVRSIYVNDRINPMCNLAFVRFLISKKNYHAHLNLYSFKQDVNVILSSRKIVWRRTYSRSRYQKKVLASLTALFWKCIFPPCLQRYIWCWWLGSLSFKWFFLICFHLISSIMIKLFTETCVNGTIVKFYSSNQTCRPWSRTDREHAKSKFRLIK